MLSGTDRHVFYLKKQNKTKTKKHLPYSVPSRKNNTGPQEDPMQKSGSADAQCRLFTT